jgi:hypothetical protein
MAHPKRVRVVIPRHVFSEARLKLAEKFCKFQACSRDFDHLQRCYPILNRDLTDVLEGILEDGEKIGKLALRLSDDYMVVEQLDKDMPTFLIDEGEIDM